jgi:hypothetical protein
MTRFTTIHTSGRFDRTPESVRGDLAAWLANDEVSLITATEFAADRRAEVFDELEGWSNFNGSEQGRGGDECLIAWRDDTWQLVHHDVSVISTVKAWSKTGHPWPPQYATTVLLLHRTACRTLQISVSHLPSHIEDGGRLRPGSRTARWLDATRQWKRQQRALARLWRPSARALVADWNFSFRVRWFRSYLGNLFPGLHPVWARPLPRLGTLARRLIDVMLVNRRLKVVVVRVLHRHRSSDHRAFETTLAWR